jgi:hypothetical protein
MMRYEQIGDPIEVISLFQNGRQRPLRFRWKNSVYNVSQVNGGWTSDLGTQRRLHYSVCADGDDVYELCFSLDTLGWELSRVCLVG